MKKQAHVIISGDVMGVGYRYWTIQNAQNLDLTGWVRNKDKKQVEAVFEGEEEKIKEMIERCKKGPEVSWVEKVEVEWIEVNEEYNGFEIRN